ncbi:uncharacterized protein LOC111043913 [Nilaparvata lugens]|uniref:uncharacterized protein LOC111043913 n=1 Tax=Nilaparvata lugens TaxID=108931 RepID=UPI00193D2AE0|nr:uncharacterized protein LOC111043913 [Nilaparvata lugens]
MTLLEKLHNLGNPRRNLNYLSYLCRSIETRSTTILTGFLIIFVITTITEMILLVGDGEHASVAHLNLSPRSDTFSATSLHSKATLQPPRLKPTSGSWQKVWGTREKFFVFSAYYEAREAEKKLRIIAVAKLDNTDDVWCRMWSVSGSHVATERAQLQAIREHWNLTYSAFYVFCPLNGIETVPHSVSLVNNPYRLIPCTNRLFVHNNLKKGNNKPNDITMAICVKPLHHYYDNTMVLLQFLEYYQLLGVSHVLLYNDTSSAATSCLLKDYERRGVVSVLPWQRLDVGSQTEIRTGGMLAALNDCLHRTTHRFTHVAMLDFDELIVPRHHHTLQDLLRWIDPSPEKSKIGSYVIQNAFFYLQWPDGVKGISSRKDCWPYRKHVA